MKKIAFCALLMTAAFAPLAFAQYGPPPYCECQPDYPPPPSPQSQPAHGGQEEGSASLPRAYLSLSFPFSVQRGFFGWDDNGLERTWAVGIDLTALFTRRLGIHLSADAYVPQTTDLFYSGGRDFADLGMASFGASFFAGPALAAIRTSRILFAVSPGIHVAGLLGAGGDFASASILFGLGGSAEIAVNLTKSWFVRASMDVTYDFAGIELQSSNSELYELDESTVTFTPSLGVGYRF